MSSTAQACRCLAPRQTGRRCRACGSGGATRKAVEPADSLAARVCIGRHVPSSTCGYALHAQPCYATAVNDFAHAGVSDNVSQHTSLRTCVLSPCYALPFHCFTSLCCRHTCSKPLLTCTLAHTVNFSVLTPGAASTEGGRYLAVVGSHAKPIRQQLAKSPAGQGCETPRLGLAVQDACAADISS